MGLLRIQTLTGRPQPAGSSPAPGPVPLSIAQPLLRKTLFILLAVTLLSVTTATQGASPQTGSNAARNPKATELNVTQEPAPPGQSAQLNQSTSLENSGAGTATNGTQSNVSVNVDGQPVAVPDNGTTQQTVTTPAGDTSVNISHSQSDTSNNFNSSFTTTTSNNGSRDTSSSIYVQINHSTNVP